MRILHVTTFLQGGAGKVVVDLARESIRRGHRVWVACTKESVDDYGNYSGHLQDLKKAGVDLFFLPSTFFRDQPNLDQSALQLRSRLPSLRVDVVHSHAAIPSLISMLSRPAFGKSPSPPIVQTMHGWGVFKSRKQELQDLSILELVDEVIPISKSSELLLREKGLKTKKCTVVYNGLEEISEATGASDPELRRIGTWKKEGCLIVGMVGTMDERKNQRLIIEAARKLPDDPRIRFVLVGEGREVERLRALSVDYGISQKILFTGYKPNGREYLGKFDLSISSSTSEGGPPLSIIEAFAEKTLVLASDLPEHREAVIPGKTGYLFENGNLDDLVAQILKITRSSNHETIKQKGYDWYRKNHRFAGTWKRYFEIYQKVSARGKKKIA